MAQVVCNYGCLAILDAFFNDGGNLTLRLFTNDVTPAAASTSSTFTEAAGGGYAAITLTAGSWTVSELAGIPQALYAQQLFNFTDALTGGASVYGYFITDADGDLITAERRTVAVTPLAGDTLAITPAMQLSHGTPTA